ncbi:MAG: hypothetical protein ACOCRK_08930 [bacterium]
MKTMRMERIMDEDFNLIAACPFFKHIKIGSYACISCNDCVSNDTCFIECSYPYREKGRFK